MPFRTIGRLPVVVAAIHVALCIAVAIFPSEGSWQWFPVFLIDFPASIAFAPLTGSLPPLVIFGTLGTVWWFVLAGAAVYVIRRVRDWRTSSEHEALRTMTLQEWSALGFYHHLDDDSKAWLIMGSRAGLTRFRDLLRAYADEPRHALISEHDHYGPYTDLKIMTWPEPRIDGETIMGPLSALRDLADRVGETIGRARVGDRISLGPTFAPGSRYDLVLVLREDAFDRAAADEASWSAHKPKTGGPAGEVKER